MKDGRKLATWRGRDGREHCAELREKNGRVFIVVQSRFYSIKFRSAAGLVRVISSGCRDRSAARARLTEILRQEERESSGLITASERSTAAEQSRPIEEHIETFVFHLETKGRAKRYVKLTKARLEAVAKEGRFRTLADATSDRLEAWLRARVDAGLGPASQAAYRAAWSAFGNWLARNRKLPENPARYLPTARISSGQKRERRALADEELVRLIEVAPEARAIVYRVMASTGLRVNETASLTVGEATLGGDEPLLRLQAEDAKNRREARIPLPRDVPGALIRHLESRLSALQARARGRREPVPMGLDTGSPLLRVPTLRTFEKDLAQTGIEKVAEDGRIVDRHSLRVTFATRLARAGVSPHHAQKLLRHSDPRLTANIYTKLEVSDLAGAVEKLTPLERKSEVVRALGVGGDVLSEFCGAPSGAPAPVRACHSESLCDALSSDRRAGDGDVSEGATQPQNRVFPAKKALSAGVAKRADLEPPIGIEPMTCSLRMSRKYISVIQGNFLELS